MSGFLDGDLLDGVRDLLEAVDRVLEGLDDVLQLEDLHRVVLTGEELGEDATVVLVALVLETVDLDPVLGELLHRAQLGHRRRGQLGAALEHGDLVGELRGQDVDAVDEDLVDNLVHRVHHVVETGAEGVDVLAVEGRDEGRVDLLDDLVGGLVCSVLRVAHPSRDVLAIGCVAEHLGEQRDTTDEVVGGLGEQVVERRVDRADSETHGGLLAG